MARALLVAVHCLWHIYPGPSCSALSSLTPSLRGLAWRAWKDCPGCFRSNRSAVGLFASTALDFDMGCSSASVVLCMRASISRTSGWRCRHLRYGSDNKVNRIGGPCLLRHTPEMIVIAVHHRLILSVTPFSTCTTSPFTVLTPFNPKPVY